tara:strand:+ start:3006 stop:3257 length:252 start_codon:yes stop_codon:yes gene_type:complete
VERNVPANSVVTVRLDPELKAKLEKLAESTNRTKSFLAAEAIRTYVDVNAWQVAEIESAIAEADAGDFLTETEQAQAYKHWTK